MAEPLQEFISRSISTQPYIIGGGILPVKGKCILGGEPKHNKSFVVINMMLDLARGRPLFGATRRNGKPILPIDRKYRVLYIEQELGELGLQKRLRGILAEQKLEGLELFVKTKDTAMRLDTPEGRDFIRNEVASVMPNVLILDPMAKFHLSEENSAQEMGMVMRVCDHLIEEFNVSIIIVHHIKKQSFENPARGGDKLRGSSAIFGDVDTFIELERLSPGGVLEPTLRLSFELRQAEPLEQMYLKRLATGECVYLGEEFRWGRSSEGAMSNSRNKFKGL